MSPSRVMFIPPGLSRYFLTASSSPALASPDFAASKFGPGSVRAKVSLTMAACGLALREHSRKISLRSAPLPGLPTGQTQGDSLAASTPKGGSTNWPPFR